MTKTIVITGASRGVGLGAAQRWATQGHQVAACARSDIDLAGDNVLTLRGDVTDERDVDALLAETEVRFGRIDLWVNNAGILDPIRFAHDMSADEFRRMMDINVTGVFLGTRAYSRHARRHGGGVLINVSSGAAGRAYAGWSAYCASKAAVERFTEAVQVEEAEHGLRAYSVAPGVIDTGMQALIRGTDEADFPMVPRFHEMKAQEAFNSPQWVADQLYALAFDPACRPETVACRIPAQG